MYYYSERSSGRLKECHGKIQLLFNMVIRHADCSILCGHRGEEEQNKVFKEGKSQLKFPKSKHNRKPSIAVDVAPYPIHWEDENAFYHFAGIVKGLAICQGIKIKWGGHWSFKDMVHWELDI